jgi:hypothetical protein
LTEQDRHWSRSLREQGITWQQFIFQFLIVAVGVWLAIIVGAYTTRNDRREAARDALRNILIELRQDETEFREVIKAQESNLAALTALSDEIAKPNPSDSLVAAVYGRGVGVGGRISGNRTVFPRGAAFSMMVASGQLEDVTKSQLRLQLAELYEHEYIRLKSNNDLCDTVWQNFQNAFSNYWDFIGNRSIGNTADRQRAANLARRAFYFNTYYIKLLKSDVVVVQNVETAIERYLD